MRFWKVHLCRSTQHICLTILPGAFPPEDVALIKIFKRLSELKTPLLGVYLFFKELFNLIISLIEGFREDTNVTENLYHHFSNQDERQQFYIRLENLIAVTVRSPHSLPLARPDAVQIGEGWTRWERWYDLRQRS